VLLAERYTTLRCRLSKPPRSDNLCTGIAAIRSSSKRGAEGTFGTSATSAARAVYIPLMRSLPVTPARMLPARMLPARTPPSRRRILAARALAVIADAIQLGLLPLFVQGAASPLNDALDVAVGAAMVALVGWNWVFLPTFVTELIPVVDLAPTWTIAALIATRPRKTEALPDTTVRS
jgi:hypothetical protein